mmetsp:Transcript_31998/g.55164  ORF Transcript_31998/g.55164 Transcript_31998/m.55164 type:complete len:375 (+) Transcript_31998:1254-2378(+)
MEPDSIVCSRYRIHEKIGAGSFGQVYRATEIETSCVVALKIEFASMRRPQLFGEARALKVLQKGVGIPNYYWTGAETGFNVIAMQLLGPSLENLLRRYRKFSMPTVLEVASQLLERIEFIHTKDYLHRDIKSDNFCMGLARKSKIVYAVDFGLAKKFRDTKTSQHMAYRESQNLTGTSRFASLNSHMGLELSRRDDLESLAYLLIYLSLGRLPWQSVKTRIKAEKHKRVMDMKTKIKPEILIDDLPQAFAQFLKYSRSLRFEQTPDYAYCKRIFQGAISTESSYEFSCFEWAPRSDKPRCRSLKLKVEHKRDPRRLSHTTLPKVLDTESSKSETATERGCYPKALNRIKLAPERIVTFDMNHKIYVEPARCVVM